MEQRERDESSSKLEEALRELTGAETKADVVNELDDDDWEQEELEELDEWDEPEKSPRGMSRLAAAFRPSDDLLAAFFLPVVILILIFAYRGIFPFGQESSFKNFTTLS